MTATPTTPTTAPLPKTAVITLTAPGARLTLVALRRATGAVTFARTTDLASKVTRRGMTEPHATFEAARAALATHAAAAEKLGWTRRGGRGGGAQPDAFTTLPAAPKAAKPAKPAEKK